MPLNVSKSVKINEDSKVKCIVQADHAHNKFDQVVVDHASGKVSTILTNHAYDNAHSEVDKVIIDSKAYRILDDQIEVAQLSASAKQKSAICTSIVDGLTNGKGNGVFIMQANTCIYADMLKVTLYIW